MQHENEGQSAMIKKKMSSISTRDALFLPRCPDRRSSPQPLLTSAFPFIRLLYYFDYGFDDTNDI